MSYANNLIPGASTLNNLFNTDFIHNSFDPDHDFNCYDGNTTSCLYYDDESLVNNLKKGNDRNRFVTNEDLQQLEYLSCVMKESQRLLSTSQSIGRDLGEDTLIGGINVPKGTHVQMLLSSLRRDPVQFPEPEKFDPDRFFPSNSQGRHNFAFIPFSAGQRYCIGQKFAVMEQKVILATILRRIEIKSLKKIEGMRFGTELGLRPVDGVHVTFTRRL